MLVERELIQQKILEFFEKNGKQIKPNIDLFESGLLDSMEIIELIVFMEEALNLKINTDKMNGANFRTLELITTTFHCDI